MTKKLIFYGAADMQDCMMNKYNKESNSVLAIIVSFNGGVQLRETATALIDQVESLLIVDNGSNESTLQVIRELEVELNIHTIFFGENIGIAGALNHGVKLAQDQGFQWILTMDQDSVAQPEMVSEMLATSSKFNNSPMVTPSIFSRVFDRVNGDVKVVYAITSGNLVPISVYSRIGLYKTDYFIDSVDFEFCLRAHNAGIKLIRSSKAFLQHQLGVAIVKSFLNFKWTYIEHKPIRRYYIYRNHFYLTAEYLQSNPYFIIKKSLVLIFYTLELIIFDTQRVENIIMILRGLNHYLKGKTGSF